MQDTISKTNVNFYNYLDWIETYKTMCQPQWHPIFIPNSTIIS